MRVLLSCGEASGDLYAGALTRELRKQRPDVVVRGRGGPEFERAGGQLIADYRGLSVTGFTEIVAKVPQLRAAKRALVDDARHTKPDVFVAIDYFGFNGRLALEIKRLGIPIVYYVSPQIWAWRSGRIKTLRRVVDRMLVIFPFEAEIYERAGVPVTFVGHPLVDLVSTTRSRALFLESLGLVASSPTVALLPGSRPGELKRILPILIEASRRIRITLPAVQFVVARAPGLDDALFAPIAHQPGMALVEKQTDDVIASADVAITASGTATVQTALHDTPMVVVYKLSALEYRLGRPFVKLDTFAMVNLIAGERIVPELIQDRFTPDTVAAETLALLTDPARATLMKTRLADVRRKLGRPGASQRAAAAVLEIAGRSVRGTA